LKDQNGKLNIQILNYEFPPIGGGAGNGSKFLARELASFGHDVEIITSAFARLPRYTFKRFPSGGTLRIKRLPVLRKEAGRCRPHEMASYIISSFAYLFFQFRKRPDVMISFHTIPSGVPALFLSILFQVPHITLFRGGDVPGFLPQDLKRLHQLTYPLNWLIVRQAQAALANSKGLQDLAQKAFPFKNVRIIQNGVDSKKFRPLKKKPNGDGVLRILFVGRMTNQKGLDNLLDALINLKRTRPHLKWHATLVGDGPLQETLIEEATAAGLKDQIDFPGWLERSELAKVYRRSDLFVFPSRFEGMSNALLEAMSSGLICLATQVQGNEELIENKKTGLFIPVDDSDALATQLAQIILHQENNQELGSNARQFVIDHYSWQQKGRVLEKEIRRAINLPFRSLKNLFGNKKSG